MSSSYVFELKRLHAAEIARYRSALLIQQDEIERLRSVLSQAEKGGFLRPGGDSVQFRPATRGRISDAHSGGR